MIGVHVKPIEVPFSLLIVDTIVRISDLPLLFIALLGSKRKKLKVEFACCPLCEQHLEWDVIRQQLNQSKCTNTNTSEKGIKRSAQERSTKNAKRAKQ